MMISRGNIAVVTAGFLAGAISGYSGAKLTTRQEKLDVEYEESTESTRNLLRTREILKYGRPDRGPEIRRYSNHTLCYDQHKKIPLWVAEHLTADNLKGNASRRSTKFRPDPEVNPFFTAHNSDYMGSGWSRGHMAPAGDNKRNDQCMKETFYLSNILPQNLDNNGGFWNRFEMYCRDLTKKFQHVRVISGPLFLPFEDEAGFSYIKYQVIGKSQVATPTHLYKVIVAEQDEQEDKYLGVFVVPNIPLSLDEQLPQYQTTLEFLESHSGYTFLPKLDRAKAKDLCTAEGCQLKGREHFELFIIAKKLEDARTLERLHKVWAELEEKNLKPDEWMMNLYEKKKAELDRAATIRAEE